jgi:hypothetical protein
MMLCVDKKMLHDCRRDRESAPLPAGAGPAGNGVREYPADGHPSPLSADDQHRRQVLLRVVRISAALNQRLAV